MVTDQPIVILAGAGASKAVAPAEYPTTVEFFDSLPNQIRQDRLFEEVEKFIRKRDPKNVLDIELVLWRLEELKAFCAQINDHSQIAGWMLNGNRLPVLLGHKHDNHGQLHDTAKSTVTALTKIGRFNK